MENKIIEIKKHEIDLNNLPYIEKEIKGENKMIYNMKIYNAKNSIIFNIKIKDTSEIIYKSEYTLEEFIKINNFFKSFSSIQEIYTNFFEDFDNIEKKEIIIEENEFKLNIIFKFKDLGKIKEIKFNFDINIKSKVLQLCNRMKEIENENNKLNEKIKEINFQKNFEKIIFYSLIIINLAYLIYNFKSIDNRLNLTKNEINDKIKNESKSIDNRLNLTKDKVNDINIYIGFLFLIFNKEYYTINDLLNKGTKKYFNKTINKYNLLYLASRDGYESKHFHEKCDGKSFTVTIVLTKENKIFGGFTELKWGRDNKHPEGNKGFIFSLDNNKIYYNKNKYSISHEYDYGPIFWNYGFVIFDSIGYDHTKNSNFSSYDVPGEEYVLAGEYKFSIKDYAVYQIELK